MQLLAHRPSSPTIGDFVAAERSANALTVTDRTGAQITVPLIWWRDNCPCNECRIESTGEHRFFLGRLDSLPDAAGISVLEGVLTIDWNDGHRSAFTTADLATLTHIADRSPVAATVWCEDFAPERFERSAILGDKATMIAFLTAAMRDGMALVTGMPNESGECIRFLESLQLPVRETPFDRLHDVYFRADGYNVAHTDEALPPHNDFASYTWPPSGQLIHMLVNDVEGGEWVNVDGFRVIARLWQQDPNAVQTLARVPMAFREHSETAESWTRAPIVRTDSAGHIVGLRFSNQLMQPMSPFDPDIEAFYNAYHQLAMLITDPANQIELPAAAGTMQFLHGHRVLHARRAFDGTSGSRHLQDTYFDFDDVAALVAMKTGEAR